MLHFVFICTQITQHDSRTSIFLFAPIAPDFVLELRSDDQSLGLLKEKMEEYMSCGCRLGWLLDPQGRRTYVYSGNGDIQTVPFDHKLTGADVLPGFEIVMADLFHL